MMAEKGSATPLSTVSRRSAPERSSVVRRNVELLRKSRCYTPYQKTPKSRHIRGSIHQQRTPPPKTSTDHFREIINKTWRVYKMSPLYGFKYDSHQLKQYSRLLAAHVISEQRKGEAVSADECADKAAFSVFKGLTSTPDGPDAVKITLRKIPKRGQESDAGVVLTAILCCVQPVSAVSRALGFTKLPVMLIKGPVALTRLLLSWLQTTFDCCADVMQFSPLQLSWMVAMWAGDVLEKKNQPVQFMYSVPSYVEGLSKVTLDLDAYDCQKVWKSIHDSESDEFTEEEVTRFIKAIEAHFYYYFKIALQGMALSRVGTATVYAGTDGRVKIFSIKHIKQVLAHVTELVTEQTLIR